MGNAALQSAKVSVDDFEVMRLAGKGAFGSVWQVFKKDTKEIFAMKILNKKDVVSQNLVDHTIQERDIMLAMKDKPFVIGLHYSFQTAEKLYFIIDYVGGGSLFSLLRSSKSGYLEEDQVVFYAVEVLIGIQELHKENIIYRDLKLENILLTDDGHVVLTDFGLSCKMKDNTGRVHSFSGTAIYLAPEILSDTGEGHGKSVDIWGYGVLLHLLLTGTPPFWSENHRELFTLIINNPVVIDDPYLSPAAADLLKMVLVKDVNSRLGMGPDGIQEIMRHPFFESVDWDRARKKKLDPPFVPSKMKGLLSDSMDVCSSLDAKSHRKKMAFFKKEEKLFKGFSFIANSMELFDQHQNGVESPLEYKESTDDLSSRKLKHMVSQAAASVGLAKLISISPTSNISSFEHGVRAEEKLPLSSRSKPSPSSKSKSPGGCTNPPPIDSPPFSPPAVSPRTGFSSDECGVTVLREKRVKKSKNRWSLGKLPTNFLSSKNNDSSKSTEDLQLSIEKSSVEYSLAASTPVSPSSSSCSSANDTVIPVRALSMSTSATIERVFTPSKKKDEMARLAEMLRDQKLNANRDRNYIDLSASLVSSKPLTRQKSSERVLRLSKEKTIYCEFCSAILSVVQLKAKCSKCGASICKLCQKPKAKQPQMFVCAGCIE